MMLRAVFRNSPCLIVPVPGKALLSQRRPESFRINSFGARHAHRCKQSFHLGPRAPLELADHAAQRLDVSGLMLDDDLGAEAFGARFEGLH